MPRPFLALARGRCLAKARPKPKRGSMNEQTQTAYTAEDIRFTTRGATLYAIALGWPESGR